MSYPLSTVTDPTDSDDTCPGCGTAHGGQPQPAPPTVEAWTCTACGLHWATTVVNPVLRVALSIVGLLPTPQQRTAALLAVLRTEVAQRSGKDPTMVSALGGAVHLLPAGEVFWQGYPSTPVAVCGEPVTGEPDGEEDHHYCPECVRVAIWWCAQPVAGDCRG